MASSTPTQTRIIDPFSSYGSDNVNELTRMITRGNDALTDVNSLQATIDSTSPLDSVVISTGIVYKDNVLITFSADHTVDFTDIDQYYTTGSAFSESGTYYIVLDYTYAKSRPVPTADIKILRPSDLPSALVGSTLFFLKAVTVIYNVDHFELSTLYDYDPADPTIKREYTSLYFGVEQSIPSHVTTRDQGRVVYESSTDTFWFGLESEWTDLTSGGGSVILDTVDNDSTALFVGCLSYIDGNSKTQPAIASDPSKRADVGIITLGTAAAGGTSLMIGVLDSVNVETGIIVSAGDVLYLSDTDEGTVTSTRPATNIQQVGRALSAGDDSTPISMLFVPRSMISTALKGIIDSSEFGLDSGYYRADVDISSLDASSTVVVTSFFADSTGTLDEIQPYKVQLLTLGGDPTIYDTLRVWMVTDTLDVHYNISSGTGGSSETGGGGGGGTTVHSLLTNLDYASSGHTGFSPNPHDNTYHSDPPSIPSGTIVLFEANTAVTGYSLLTTIDDQLVYITSGSGAGGETGGTAKSGSTWTQPNHTHTTGTTGNHTHTGGSHALTFSEMPAHTHSYTYRLNTGSYASGGGSDVWHSTSVGTTSIAGGGGSHSHGATSSDGSHNHGATGSSATANTWRPTGRNFTRQQKS